MITIKIMSGENLPDSDVAKAFRIVCVGSGDTFVFGHDSEGQPTVEVSARQGEEWNTSTYVLTGNAYVMNEQGKTIATFWGRRKLTPMSVPPIVVTGSKTQERIEETQRRILDSKDTNPEPKITYVGDCFVSEDNRSIGQSNPQVFNNTPAVNDPVAAPHPIS